MPVLASCPCVCLVQSSMYPHTGTLAIPFLAVQLEPASPQRSEGVAGKFRRQSSQEDMAVQPRAAARLALPMQAAPEAAEAEALSPSLPTTPNLQGPRPSRCGPCTLYRECQAPPFMSCHGTPADMLADTMCNMCFQTTAGNISCLSFLCLLSFS